MLVLSFFLSSDVVLHKILSESPLTKPTESLLIPLWVTFRIFNPSPYHLIGSN